MIRISYVSAGNRHRLVIEGHAMSDEHGKDIVCAGVSAISFALMGYIRSTDAEIAEISFCSGNVNLDCSGDERIQAAFDMAMTGYANIANHYPRNVVIYIASNGG